MTARRGSLRFKIVRFAREPRVYGTHLLSVWRVTLRSASIAGRAVFAVALLFIAGTLGAQVWRVGAENVRLHQAIIAAERDNGRIARSADNLSVRVHKLHDPEYLVPLIHEQLGLTKPHEIFVQVKGQTALPAQQ